jgi:hypothetical protein
MCQSGLRALSKYLRDSSDTCGHTAFVGPASEEAELIAQSSVPEKEWIRVELTATQWVMPGLIDSHVHASQVSHASALMSATTLTAWQASLHMKSKWGTCGVGVGRGGGGGGQSCNAVRLCNLEYSVRKGSAPYSILEFDTSIRHSGSSESFHKGHG